MRSGRNLYKILFVSASAISVAAWAYRLTQDYWRPVDLQYAAVACLVPLALLAVCLYFALDRCWWKRVMGIVLGIPLVPLWLISIMIGMYGLKIH